MPEIRYTLLADGTSDRSLMPHLTWLLQQRLPDYAVQPTMAELWRMPKPPKSLGDRIEQTLILFPCDLLFVHRDAEREPRTARVDEIRGALSDIKQISSVPPAICVVPVRMQEAWLLFNEEAIRRAAGNPNGRMPLSLPSVASVEDRPDPKLELYELLRTASGLGIHRRQRFSRQEAAQRVSEYIDDFSALRSVPAFRELEVEIDTAARIHRW